MTVVFGPYTQVRDAGGFLFVSGQVGVNPSNGTAPKDLAAQTDRMLLNLENVLQRAGASLDDVVKTTVYLTDVTDYEVMNKVYVQRFAAPRPARSTVGVKELPRVAKDTELLVAVDAVALKKKA